MISSTMYIVLYTVQNPGVGLDATIASPYTAHYEPLKSFDDL